VHDRELELIRCLVDLPHVVDEAAKDRAPHKVTNWVRLLAGEFHGFYHDCRVLSDEMPPELTQARCGWSKESGSVSRSLSAFSGSGRRTRCDRGSIWGAPARVCPATGPIGWDSCPTRRQLAAAGI